MKSSELRTAVDALTPEIVAQVLHDLEWDAHRRETLAAVRALADHADALVALVEACERQSRQWVGPDEALLPTIRGVKSALAAVHATKGTP